MFCPHFFFKELNLFGNLAFSLQPPNLSSLQRSAKRQHLKYENKSFLGYFSHLIINTYIYISYIFKSLALQEALFIMVNVDISEPQQRQQRQPESRKQLQRRSRSRRRLVFHQRQKCQKF